MVAGLILPRIESAGAMAIAAERVATNAGLRLRRFNPLRRAVLRVSPGAAFEENAARKHRKEWARQGRRLSEKGRLVSRVVSDADAISRFLDLEARGWKGARGTALRQHPGHESFTREMLEGFSRAGQMRVHELALDDAPVAMGVELRAGRSAYFWKTAYDEAFASYSPGVQLSRELSRRLVADPDLDLVDSCAIENHPMIDRIWPDRLDLTDIALSSRRTNGGRLTLALTVEDAARILKSAIKRIVFPWLGRKLS